MNPLIYTIDRKINIDPAKAIKAWLIRKRLSPKIKFLIFSVFLSINVTLAQNNELINFSSRIEALTETVGKSVVKIIVTAYGPGYQGQKDRLVKYLGNGSGVIVDPSGYIITNAHVVEGAIKVNVQLSTLLNRSKTSDEVSMSPGKIVDAKIIAVNKATDVALLKIEGENYPALKFGDSRKVNQGSLVFAFGSPRGLENSVSMGIVSSAGRQIQEENAILYIQTDAAINPGNSGGPLVNPDGDIIGINTMIYSGSGGSEGIGFAVPSNAVNYVYQQLKTTGMLKIGTIGVKTQNITEQLAIGLKLQQQTGVIVSDVIPGSPAEIAGVKQGDIILSLDGDAMENSREFVVSTLVKNDGETVSLTILRDYERFKLNVEIVTIDDKSNFLKELLTAKQEFVSKLGVTLLIIDDEVKQLIPPIRKVRGMIVTALIGNVTNWQGGIKTGDIIYSINRVPLYSFDILNSQLDTIEAGDPVVLEIEREGSIFYLAYEFE